MKRLLVAAAVAAMLFSSTGAVQAKRGTSARADQPSIFMRVAVLLINFTNQPSETFAKEDVERLYFTGQRSVATYFDEVSEGRMQVTGQVFGYLKAGARSGYCEIKTWGSRARTAAARAGIDLSQFTNVVYIFPFQPACKWNGFADHTKGSPVSRNNWINGLLSLFVAAHELGHNKGLGHAGSTTCTVDGVRVAIGGSCKTYEYGDPFSIMGYTGDRHMHTWQRLRLGFITEDEVLTVTQDGTYRVSTAESGGENPRLIRIPRANGSPLYLEYRQPFGTFDDFGDNAPVVSGVTIRIATDGNYTNTRLIDTTPETCTFNDAALALGKTFRDPGNRIQITTTAAGPNSAEIQVNFGGAAIAAGDGEEDPPPTDSEPPSAVSNIAVQQVTGRLVALSWSKATDNDRVARYEVYADGVLKGTTCDLRFRNITLADGRPHQLDVRAVDATGNLGPFESIGYTPPDFTSPVMYRRIFLARSGPNVNVTWRTARDNAGVAFYRVMRDGRLLADVNPANRSFLDKSPLAGTHRYSVTAFDAAGNASRPIRRKITR